MTKRHAIPRLLAAWATVAWFSGQALGQITPDAFTTKSSTDLLREFEYRGLGTVHGQELLIGVLNKGLSPSAENLESVRQNLARVKSQDEKILLVRVLASMYTPRSRSQQNLMIEGDIKGLVNSPDLRIAREAVLEYSRLAYPPDRYQVLRRAHDGKVIGDDAYYGELAHGLRFSSVVDQSQMMAELEGAHNQFAAEVLASSFGDQQLLGQLNRATQVRLLKLLSNHEPGFPLALDSFGLIDVVRYVFWINTVSTIDSMLSGTSYAQLVVTRLSDPGTDPRKILAVFSNPEGKRVVRETSEVAKLRTLLNRAEVYSNSLPQNTMLRSATGIFSSQLSAARKGEPP